jgi:hypothetical protein
MSPRRRTIRSVCLSAFAAAAGAILSAGAALSAGAVDEAVYRATAGRWLIAPEGGGKGCVITLSTETTIGGRRLDGVAGCKGAVPAVAEAASWDFDNEKSGIVFRDALRKRLLEVVEQETATYRQEPADPGKALVMFPARGSMDRVPSPGDLFGEWQMRRPGGAVLCTVTLLERTAPGDQGSYTLTLARECDAGLVRLKLSTWRVEGMDLMFYSFEGDSLAFTPRAPGAYAKSEKESGKPLDLIKTK